jgi:hypothetical protein
MYLFWELVGVCSYLLIGFYYPKHAAVHASKKAFIVTRFADLFCPGRCRQVWLCIAIRVYLCIPFGMYHRWYLNRKKGG